MLALCAQRKPLVPRFVELQEKPVDLLGRGLHLTKQAGASALYRQHLQSLGVETSASENFDISYHDFGVSFVNKACGSQHLLVDL